MDSAGPMSLLSSPAIYLTDGMMRKAGDEKKNVIQSTWTRSTDFSKASAFPFSVRWTMLLNFGIGIKSGLMIGLLQLMVAITFYAKYEEESASFCASLGFCDQKVPRIMRAMFILSLFEIAIDTIFGVFFIVRTNHIQNLVFWVSSHSELRPSEMYRVLDIMTWGIFAFIVPLWIFSMVLAITSTYYHTNEVLAAVKAHISLARNLLTPCAPPLATQHSGGSSFFTRSTFSTHGARCFSPFCGYGKTGY